MTLTVVSNPSLGGSASALPGPAANGKYYANAPVTLTAQPSVGYVFVKWSGDTGGITDFAAFNESIPYSHQTSTTLPKKLSNVYYTFKDFLKIFVKVAVLFCPMGQLT